MTALNRNRFIVYTTLWGAVIAIAWFLWHEDFVNFWTVIFGAAYLLLDRWPEKENEGDNDNKDNPV